MVLTLSCMLKDIDLVSNLFDAAVQNFEPPNIVKFVNRFCLIEQNKFIYLRHYDYSKYYLNETTQSCLSKYCLFSRFRRL